MVYTLPNGIQIDITLSKNQIAAAQREEARDATRVNMFHVLDRLSGQRFQVRPSDLR